MTTRHGRGAQPGEGQQDGPKALQVAALTVANGSDNIGVYLPVFRWHLGGCPSNLRP